MKTKFKLLSHVAWHSIIIYYALKDKPMIEVFTSIDIIIILSTQGIPRQKKCQIWKLDKLVLKQDVDFLPLINDFPI